MTDPLGQSQVIPYLLGLSKKGYSFYLLSCEKEQVFEKNRAIVETLLHESGIQWIPLKYTKRPPVVSTLIDIFKLRRAAARIHKKVGLDLVHTRPGIPSLVGLWLKKRYGIKFLNDIREFYADSRVEGGMWDKRNFIFKNIYGYFKKQEALQVAASDGIVCLTHAAEKIIRSWPEYNKHTPLEVIPCSVDLELFDSSKFMHSDLTLTREKLGFASGDRVFTYLGSIGGWYLTNDMLRFCKCLSDRIPNVKFLFISPHQHDQILFYALSHGIPSEKLIITSASRADVPHYLSISEYSIFFIKPCYSKLSSSPTKHGELMSMGIPVITNAGVGDVEEIVNTYSGGIVLQDFSDLEFNNAVDLLKDKQFPPETIRQGAVEVYSLNQAISRYQKIYGAVLN
jgi:glycosyltransferase involved in cell wall biosynthesis